MGEIDIDHLRQWVGKREKRNDTITNGLIERYRATLSDLVKTPENAVPLALHWCLAPSAVAESETGQDGHPARGGFLPPVENARRMWGGGELRFVRPFNAGDDVERISRIAEVDFKRGKSGGLVIVGVDHEYKTAAGICLNERQNIIYRLSADTEVVQSVSDRGESAQDADKEIETGEHVRRGFATILLMFRYSALTFNGHRIHYDRNYAMQEEGYPGLVFHGPLQASLLVNFAQELFGDNPLRHFAYKGLSPMFDGTHFTLNANASQTGLSLWVCDDAGRKTMIASASC